MNEDLKPSVLLCCIAKMENLYLRDFVEYYKNLGVENIVLYDNNDVNGEYPQQVIGDYISNGFVIYKNARGLHRYQLKAYTECYKEYRESYDWLAFFDIDEFVELTNNKTIGEFLSKPEFEKATSVLLYWRQYGDNGLLHYDKRPVYERFIHAEQPGTEKNNFKVILRGGDNVDVEFIDANSIRFFTRVPWVCKNSAGATVQLAHEYTSFSYENAYLKHYATLTIDEFLARRFGRRSYADENSNFTKDVVMSIFYSLCKATEEKEKIINEFFNNFEMVEDILPKNK